MYERLVPQELQRSGTQPFPEPAIEMVEDATDRIRPIGRSLLFVDLGRKGPSRPLTRCRRPVLEEDRVDLADEFVDPDQEIE